MKIFGTFPENDTERQFLYWMKDNLPVDWIVITNIVWVFGNGTYVKDGQADFVLLIPNAGMLVLELKGSSNIRVNTENGRWQRKEKANWISCPNPIEQVMKNKHQLRKRIQNQMDTKDRFFPYGGMVIYPKGVISSPHPLVDEAIIVDKNGLSTFQQQCQNLLKKCHQLTPDKSISFGYDFAINVAQILSGIPHAVIDEQLDSVQNDAFSNDVQEWTPIQVSTLIGLSRSSRISVLGVAGSGKTQIAINHLSISLAQGERAIYVTKSPMLVTWLRYHNPNLSDHICTIDELTNHLGLADLESIAFSTDHHNSFDTLILDEAQDVDEDMLFDLLLLVTDGCFITFWDDFQNLFGNDNSILHELDVHYRLRENKRNPEKVVHFLKNYSTTLQRKIGTCFNTNEGAVFEHILPDMQSFVLLLKQSVQNGHRVVLLPDDSQIISLIHYLKKANLSCTTNIEEWFVHQNMLITSIHNFKGIEATEVWLCTVNNQLSEQHLWTACTRCVHSLHYVVLSAEENFDKNN